MGVQALTSAAQQHKKSKGKKHRKQEEEDAIVVMRGKKDAASGSTLAKDAMIAPEIAPESKEEKEQLEQVLKDTPEFISLLTEFTGKTLEARKHIDAITEKIRNNELPIEKGLSFLEVKLQLLLSYCVSLAFAMLVKTEGSTPFAGHPVVDQLIELRVFIEKIRPLDNKLKNQIEKLIRTAAVSDQAVDGSNPLQFRPNPDAFVSKEEDDADAVEEADDAEADTAGVYVPPRIAAVRFDDTAVDKKRKKEERQAKKLRDSELYRELQEEFAEEPTEVKDYSRLFAGEVYNKAEQERQLRFEEENFRRLAETKQQKKARKAQKFRNELDELTEFGRFARMAGRGPSNDGDLDKLKRKKSLKEFMAAEKKNNAPPRKKHRKK